MVDNVVKRCVSHAALPAFGERRANGEGDDHIIWILLGARKEYDISSNAPEQKTILKGKAHMVERPLLLGVRWLRMEPSLSAAMMKGGG